MVLCILLTGFSCNLAVSTAAETSPIRRDATHVQLQHGRMGQSFQLDSKKGL